MAQKAYIIGGNLARYTDEEFSAIQTELYSEGVFNANGTNDDLLVDERAAGANMSVDVNTGKCLIEFTKNGFVWKVIAYNNAVENLTIASNSSGSNRLDAIVMTLDAVTEPNALKNNIAALEVVTGSGATALTDGAIDSALGHTNWYRLADVTVANGATSIVTANISDTREAIRIGRDDGGYMSIYQGDGSQMSGILLNPLADDFLPTTTDTYDIGSATYEWSNVYAQYFHGDGSALTNLSVGGFQQSFTLGEAYPINDFPFVVQETYSGSGTSRESVYTTNWFAQTFTVPTGVTKISRIDLLGIHAGNLADSDTITVEIRATSAGLPTGSALASQTVMAIEVGNPGGSSDFGTYQNNEWVNFVLSSDLTVTAGAVYAIVVHLASGIGSSTNCFKWAESTTTVYSGGNGCSSTNSGSSWSTQSYDFCFRVFGSYTGGVYPFYLEDGIHTEEAFLQNTNTNGASGVESKIYTTNRTGQTFKVRGFDYLTKIKVQCGQSGATGSWTLNFSLYACDANGQPTGAAIWSDTSQTVSTATTSTYLTLTVNTAVTDGNRYCLTAAMASNGTSTAYFYMKTSDTTTSNGGGMPMSWMVTSTDGGTTWSNSKARDVALTVYGYKSRTAGRVYRIDPGHVDRQKLVGWSMDTTAAAAAASITLKTDGAVENIATTLTPSYEYWLSMDGFTPSTTPPTALTTSNAMTYLHQLYANGGHVWLGQALTSSKLQNTKRWPEQFITVATDSDQSYTTADTSYIQAPKDARYAIVYVQLSTGSYTRLEIRLDRFAKTTGTAGASGSATAYTVTATWDTTNNRIAMTCAGATRGNSYAFFYR